MIKISNLNKSFDGMQVFKNYNLEIEDGAFAILTGKSGCGKTTLLNMIGAIEDFDSGKIIVDGIDIGKRKNQFLYFRDKVGFLFQNFALIEQKSVKKNLLLVKKSF